jgi:hypothetical protein
LTEEKQAFCKRCGKLFPIKFLGKKNEQKFCAAACQTEYHKERLTKAKALLRAYEEGRIL